MRQKITTSNRYLITIVFSLTNHAHYCIICIYADMQQKVIKNTQKQAMMAMATPYIKKTND